jgi:hypothetical protein
LLKSKRYKVDDKKTSDGLGGKNVVNGKDVRRNIFELLGGKNLMKRSRIIFLFLFGGISIICFLLSCVNTGIAVQGKNYFLGKTEADIVEYFGYSGVVADYMSEYDKALSFTNQVITRYMDKTTVTTYKTTSRYSPNVYRLDYSEHNDGCLVLSENYHYRPGDYRAGEGGVTIQISPPKHRNDNAVVRAEINRFNSEVRRLDAVSVDNQQGSLNSTKIGSWYFVYRVDHDQAYDSILRETFVRYHCNIWRVNVVADNRSTTETHIAYTYNNRSQQYYSENGSAISEEQANSNENYYVRQGFTARTRAKGVSVLAYIKDGKIVKVE